MSINPGDYRIVTTLVDSITAGNKSTEQHVVKNVESNTSKADTFLSCKFKFQRDYELLSLCSTTSGVGH